MIVVTWFTWIKFWHHHASQLFILEIILHQGLKTLILEAYPYQFQTVLMYDLLLGEHQLVVHDDEAGYPAPLRKRYCDITMILILYTEVHIRCTK